MSDHNELGEEVKQVAEKLELNGFSHPAWDEPVICRVEVDLPAWLKQLTGGRVWEVCSESEDDTCISFAMREKLRDVQANQSGIKIAEVTLYHNGYAVVDLEGQALFDGTLTSGTSNCAHLSYYNAESGEPITLN